MKNIFTKLSAMLLAVWYSLSIIGFDVHTCNGSGKTYIATVVGGFSCEDIHPGHGVSEHSHVPGECCCHSHESEFDGGLEITPLPCCSDDYHVIYLTGVRSDDESERTGTLNGEGQYCILNTHIENPKFNIFHSGLRAFYKPRSGDPVPLDVQVAYNIWRI